MVNGIRERVLDKNLCFSRIPGDYARSTLDDIEDPKLRELARRYSENVVSLVRSGHGFLLADGSEKGGKGAHVQMTTAAVAVRAAVEKNLRAYCVGAPELQSLILKGVSVGRDGDGDPIPVLDHAEGVDLLWLHGFGLEHAKTEDAFSRNTLQNLLYQRFVDGRATIITSPLTLPAVTDRYRTVLEILASAKKLHGFEVVVDDQG